MPTSASQPLQKLPKLLQWALLLIFSILFAALLRFAHLPAALLLGPLLAAICLATSGGELSIPKLPYSFAQATIGCLVGRMITSNILTDFLKQGPLLIGVVLVVIAASSLIGYLMSRLKILPDTTAIWGLLPGAASTMMLMADAFGADARLVAFMQYLRVVFVAAAASLVGRFFVHVSTAATPLPWFPPLNGTALVETLGLIALSMFLGPRLKIPAGVMLIPLVGGAVLQNTGLLHLELPPWLLGISYCLLGWSIGLRFTRAILAYAFRALPQIVLSIFLLMSFCGALAWLLSKSLGLDLLTTYLATSPGGMDSIAIIAAATKVNMPFVMAMQTLRLLLIIMAGPPLSRWVARRLTLEKGK